MNDSSMIEWLSKLAQDSKDVIFTSTQMLYDFVVPKWTIQSMMPNTTVRDLLLEHSSSPMEFMLRNFDINNDGHISRNELLNMTDFMQHMMDMTTHYKMSQESWGAWFQREWPMMDWKIGMFVWRSFGGLLLFLTVLSIVPGRLHAIAGKILRWPVLALTYFLIVTELVVYTAIRLIIRILEYCIARPKHRKLRRHMSQAKSYPEWYASAAELDRSQNRDRWLRQIVDGTTSKRYNWGFILELMNDMQRARTKEDSLLALAVLQQCTRKNVGGIMSEDLFSYSNTGEPKQIVKEFVEEVVTSLHWLTREVEKVAFDEAKMNEYDDDNALSDLHLPQMPQKQKEYEAMLEKKVREEKKKLWTSLISVTLNMLGENNNNGKNRQGSSPKISKKSPSRESPVTPSPATQESLSIYHHMEVLSSLKRARAAYGRTALCLSGGAMMGLYHFGHVLGLLEAGVLPHIISGTSGGSVVGAMLATRTDDELRRDLDPQILVKYLTCFDRPWGERLKSVRETGSLFSFDSWMEKIQWFTCEQMTFAEAYRKTGRVFCVTLSSTTKKSPPVLLNYLTAPNVTVASAVIASAAVPGFVPPVKLQYKDADGVVRSQEGETFFDGSIEQDIPVSGLAEMFNCQFFIACQCNPHVVPFFYNSKGGVGRPSRWSSGTQEDSWRGGFLLSALELYLKNSMKSRFRFLHEIEAAVGFTSSMMVQEFIGSTTIVPQVDFVDYFRLFSDPELDHLYKYFQKGSVAAYEHIAMIKLHYGLVDTLDQCIDRLEEGHGKKRSSAKPRAKVLVPQSKTKATIVIPESKGFAADALTPTAAGNQTGVRARGSFSSDTVIFEDEDEDEFERRWVQCSFDS